MATPTEPHVIVYPDNRHIVISGDKDLLVQFGCDSGQLHECILPAHQVIRVDIRDMEAPDGNTD